MKTVVCIAVAAFLGTAIGPSHGFFHESSHGPCHGHPHGPPHGHFHRIFYGHFHGRHHQHHHGAGYGFHGYHYFTTQGPPAQDTTKKPIYTTQLPSTWTTIPVPTHIRRPTHIPTATTFATPTTTRVSSRPTTTIDPTNIPTTSAGPIPVPTHTENTSLTAQSTRTPTITTLATPITTRVTSRPTTTIGPTNTLIISAGVIPVPTQTEETSPTPQPTRTPTITMLTTPTTTRVTSQPTTTIDPTNIPTTSTESISQSTSTTWHSSKLIQETAYRQRTSSSSPSETTTNAGKVPLNIAPEVQKCIESCVTTPVYYPVCGTDGKTYENEGKLLCAQSCGVDVTLQSRSVCPPPPFANGNNGETPTTTLAPPSTINVGRPASISQVHQCMKQCQITPSFSPVCGTDLVTYMNIDRLKCAQGCGEAVEVLCEKPCAVCGFNLVTTPKPSMTTVKPTAPGDVGRTALDYIIQDCIKACSTTPEYNPVCGTNNVTYSNLGYLNCAQLCGVDVRVARMSPCGPTTTTTSTTAGSSSTISPDAVKLCIRRCPVTSEYNPVCGTDNVTYNNPASLECAKSCGVDVEIKRKTRCLNNLTDSSAGTTTLLSTVVLGGKKCPLPTTSPSTTTSTTRNITPSTTKVTTPSTASKTTTLPTNKLGFLIPQKILDEVFGTSISTTQLPRTTSTSKDNDMIFLIDPRFGHGNTEKLSSNITT